ncbi:MAG: M15 family metallopeptidase [Alphaproteobacteria bacterium]|nr:M15 family metallopeptidase [Alphaproteobacteria bacterium]
MTQWPTQRDCDDFYGRPIRADGSINQAWAAQNLVVVKPPFTVYYGTTPVKGIRVHRKCAESLSRVLDRIWASAGRQQSVVDAWGASKFAGSWVVRNKRGGGTLSMHAYGCAIDLDPARNAFHSTRPNFGKMPAFKVVEAFEAEGWTWGGRWSGRSCDGMHFQAARTSAVTAQQLRAAGSRTIASTDSIRGSAAGIALSGGSAVGLLSQANDIGGQAVSLATNVADGRETLSGLAANWQLFVITALVCVVAYLLWRVWRSARAAETARIDDASTGINADQVLMDFPQKGNVVDGVEF